MTKPYVRLAADVQGEFAPLASAVIQPQPVLLIGAEKKVFEASDSDDLAFINYGAYDKTTDTDYDGPLDDPQCTEDDIDYLLSAINANNVNTITRDDIVGTWAGLRPLVKSASSGRTADLSRGHNIHRSPSGKPDYPWATALAKDAVGANA